MLRGGGDAHDTCGPALNLGPLQGVLEDAHVFSRTGSIAYYGAPRFIAKTVFQKASDGDFRLANYSKKLYESAVPKSGCTGTIFGTWETERGRVNIRRVGDSGIQGTYVRNNGTFSLKPERDDYNTGGYVGEWKDDTGSGAMALVRYGNNFSASLSRGSEAAISSNKRTEDPSIGAISPENREPEKLNKERMLARDGLPPGEPLTGKCVP